MHSRSFQKKKVLITAGPTYEAIDPVRFIGNWSTGKMGFALAEECAARGADEENQKRGRPLQYQNRGTIKYVWTTNGPAPLDYQRSPLDYEHYLTRQLQPVAEGILPFIEDNFATLMTGQLGLF